MNVRNLLLLAVALAAPGCGNYVPGDVKCETDDECPAPRKCVAVSSVMVGTGDCLASSGVKVCRAICDDRAQVTPCGCQ